MSVLLSWRVVVLIALLSSAAFFIAKSVRSMFSNAVAEKDTGGVTGRKIHSAGVGQVTGPWVYEYLMGDESKKDRTLPTKWAEMIKFGFIKRVDFRFTFFGDKTKYLGGEKPDPHSVHFSKWRPSPEINASRIEGRFWEKAPEGSSGGFYLKHPEECKVCDYKGICINYCSELQVEFVWFSMPLQTKTNISGGYDSHINAFNTGMDARDGLRRALDIILMNDGRADEIELYDLQDRRPPSGGKLSRTDPRMLYEDCIRAFTTPPPKNSWMMNLGMFTQKVYRLEFIYQTREASKIIDFEEFSLEAVETLKENVPCDMPTLAEIQREVEENFLDRLELGASSILGSHMSKLGQAGDYGHLWNAFPKDDDKALSHTEFFTFLELVGVFLADCHGFPVKATYTPDDMSASGESGPGILYTIRAKVFWPRESPEYDCQDTDMRDEWFTMVSNRQNQAFKAGQSSKTFSYDVVLQQITRIMKHPKFYGEQYVLDWGGR